MQQVNIRGMKGERNTKISENILWRCSSCLPVSMSVMAKGHQLVCVSPGKRIRAVGGTFYLGVPVGVGSSCLCTCYGTAVVQGTGSLASGVRASGDNLKHRTLNSY